MISMPDGPAVTVVAGQTKSPAMLTDETISDSENIAIFSPAGLVAAASLEVSLNFDRNYRAKNQTLAQATAAATWVAPPAGAALGAAGALVVVDLKNLTSVAWRISLAAGDAADRTFLTVKRAYGPNSQAGY